MTIQEIIYRRIKYQMEHEYLYLVPEINLVHFARIVQTNTTYLSNVINQQMGCNFRTLLMRYRIQYACRLLDAGRIDMPSLPKTCGFRSKSAFYEAFQTITGMNPRDYLKQKAEK